MYIIIHLFGKSCALIGFGTIPFLTNGVIAFDRGVVTILLAFILCAICETGEVKNETNINF